MVYLLKTFFFLNATCGSRKLSHSNFVLGKTRVFSHCGLLLFPTDRERNFCECSSKKTAYLLLQRDRNCQKIVDVKTLQSHRLLGPEKSLSKSTLSYTIEHLLRVWSAKLWRVIWTEIPYETPKWNWTNFYSTRVNIELHLWCQNMFCRYVSIGLRIIFCW